MVDEIKRRVWVLSAYKDVRIKAGGGLIIWIELLCLMHILPWLVKNKLKLCSGPRPILAGDRGREELEQRLVILSLLVLGRLVSVFLMLQVVKVVFNVIDFLNVAEVLFVNICRFLCHDRPVELKAEVAALGSFYELTFGWVTRELLLDQEDGLLGLLVRSEQCVALRVVVQSLKRPRLLSTIQRNTIATFLQDLYPLHPMPRALVSEDHSREAQFVVEAASGERGAEKRRDVRGRRSRPLVGVTPSVGPSGLAGFVEGTLV